MKAQQGKDLLLKVSDGASPPIFQTIGGLRSRSFSLNAGTIDITHSQSEGGWRELLAGSGVRQASVSGSGVFLNDNSAELVRGLFFMGTITSWQLVIPGFGMIEGPFQIANLDYAGDYDGEATISLALESAGVLTFTPEDA